MCFLFTAIFLERMKIRTSNIVDYMPSFIYDKLST